MGEGSGDGEGRKETHTHTQIHKGRTICDGLEPCDWSGDRVQVTGRGFCLFVLSNHR